MSLFLLHKFDSIFGGANKCYFNIQHKNVHHDNILLFVVNTTSFLSDDTMMLETDLILRGIGTENQTNIPVHAHPPDTDSDVTLVEWLDRATKEPDKGMKLDFKYIEAVEPSMQIIKDKEDQLHTPLWVNADIVIGPNSPKDPIPPREFIDSCNQYFPYTTMSLGFTTFWNASTAEDMYTWQMIFDNLQYSYPLMQPVTFPIRAIWCVRSWMKFTWLLGLKDDFSITVWSGVNDVVNVSGLINLRFHGDVQRIYYDLPDPLMEEFKMALKDDATQPTPKMPMWNCDLWEAVPSQTESDFVFLSTESVGIMGGQNQDSYAGWVQSKNQHMPSKKQDMLVSGTVQFVDKYESNSGKTVLDIGFRTSGVSAQPVTGVTDGICASIGNDGSVSLRDMQSNVVVATSLPAAECYWFEITDSAKNATCQLRVQIIRCADANSSPPNQGKWVPVELSQVPGLDKYNGYYVAFGKMGNSKDVVIEEFHVSSAAAAVKVKWLTLFIKIILVIIVHT